MLAIDLVRLVMEPSIAPAHPLSPDQSYWRVWPLQPTFLFPVLLAAVIYARGLTRWPERSRSHPWWRTALFYGGLGTMVLSVNTPLHAISEHHFSAHMTQHLLITLIGVPMVLLGAPTTPMLRGLPGVVRHNVISLLAADPIIRGVFHVLTHPVTSIVLFSAVLIWWHMVAGWYDLAAANEGWHEVQHLSFVITAGLFWWNVIDPAPLHAPMGYLLRIVYVIAEATVQAVLGAFISLATEPIYHFYEQASPIFPISPIDDQQLGGLIMWIGGQPLFLCVLGALFAVWWVQSERRQQSLEAAGLEATADRY